jgi:solute carrier family 25 (mitochondrial carnitine/acylcarnitine transporter), member 20/29
MSHHCSSTLIHPSSSVYVSLSSLSLSLSSKSTYTGLVHCYQDLIKTEGYRALYKGVSPVMLRAFPANAACFFGVEMARSFLNWVVPDN